MNKAVIEGIIEELRMQIQESKNRVYNEEELQEEAHKRIDKLLLLLEVQE